MRSTIFALLLCVCAQFAFCADEPGPRLLVGGWGLPYLAVTKPDGTIEWKLPNKGRTCDAWMLPDGNIVFCENSRVCEVKPDWEKGGGAEVWARATPADAETDGCYPIDEQHVLITESRNNKLDLVELARGGKDGKEAKETKRISLEIKGGKHSMCRQARKTAAGTYWVALYGCNEAREYDGEGKLLRTVKGSRFAAQPLDNGNILLGGGDNHTITEVDPAGKVVWQVGAKEIEDVELGFVAGVWRMPDGSTLFCNWTGHRSGKGPCITRISPEKKVTWSLKLEPINRAVCFQVLPPGTPPKPELRLPGKK